MNSTLFFLLFFLFRVQYFVLSKLNQYKILGKLHARVQLFAGLVPLNKGGNGTALFRSYENNRSGYPEQNVQCSGTDVLMILYRKKIKRKEKKYKEELH